jgi:hypothetical protein
METPPTTELIEIHPTETPSTGTTPTTISTTPRPPTMPLQTLPLRRSSTEGQHTAATTIPPTITKGTRKVSNPIV